MLKHLNIEGLFGRKDPTDLPLSQDLTILTGDNGAGKTTLLNIVFNILNGNFDALQKTQFEKISLELDNETTNKSSKLRYYLVNSIEVQKKEESLIITYALLDQTYVIKAQKNRGFYNNQTSYEILMPQHLVNNSSEIDKYQLQFTWAMPSSFSDFIAKYEELKFINLLKDSVIYFPTYRRIDSDIIQLLEQNYPVGNEVDLSEINRTINNFPEDRRVVGVNDNDIEHLFKVYSEKTRKVNSDGLNTVLKSFIGQTIASTYEKNRNSNSEKRDSTPSNLYDIAPNQLIDLSKQLGINQIDEDQIKSYFSKQKTIAKYSKETSLNISVRTNNDNDKNSEDSELIKESIEDVLLSSLLSVSAKDNLIINLINLYDGHMKKVNKQLEPYEHLKASFQVFFKNKITLSLQNYNMTLSRSFRELSTGEKQLITLFSYAVLSMNSNLYKPLIIIDEPELSLHISWQMKLLNELKKIPNINLLLATHSPYIANIDYEDSIWQLGDIDAN